MELYLAVPGVGWCRRMRRLRCALTPCLVALSCLLRVSAARAELSTPELVSPSVAEPSPQQAGAPAAAVPRAPASHAPASRAGLDLLASFGYGASTANVLGLELQPYGASFGLDVGYTFRSGFRVGGVVGYGLGRTVKQRHEATVGDDFDFAANSSMLNVASSLGYDVPLFFMVLRYTVNMGVSVMSWDFGGVPPKLVLKNLASSSPTAGVFVAPGVTLLWRHAAFESGLGFDYLVQSNDAIPPGFLGKLLVGVKL